MANKTMNISRSALKKAANFNDRLYQSFQRHPEGGWKNPDEIVAVIYPTGKKVHFEPWRDVKFNSMYGDVHFAPLTNIRNTAQKTLTFREKTGWDEFAQTVELKWVK